MSKTKLKTKSRVPKGVVVRKSPFLDSPTVVETPSKTEELDARDGVVLKPSDFSSTASSLRMLKSGLPEVDLKESRERIPSTVIRIKPGKKGKPPLRSLTAAEFNSLHDNLDLLSFTEAFGSEDFSQPALEVSSSLSPHQSIGAVNEALDEQINANIRGKEEREKNEKELEGKEKKEEEGSESGAEQASDAGDVQTQSLLFENN